MVSLYKDPLGENVFSTSVATQQGNNSSVGGDRKVIVSSFPVYTINLNPTFPSSRYFRWEALMTIPKWLLPHCKLK